MGDPEPVDYWGTFYRIKHADIPDGERAWWAITLGAIRAMPVILYRNRRPQPKDLV